MIKFCANLPLPRRFSSYMYGDVKDEILNLESDARYASEVVQTDLF